MNDALDVVYNAVKCYAEDCISNDSEALVELNAAWEMILEKLEEPVDVE